MKTVISYFLTLCFVTFMHLFLIRCARATLKVQAHGTPIAHNVVLAGTPTFEG